MGDLPIAGPLSIQDSITQRNASIPRVEFEPTIPVFEQSKDIRALDCVATGIGIGSGE